MDQPQSFGDFAHGTYTGYNRRSYTKLTCPPSPTTTGARGPRFQLETRSHTTCERLIVHSQTGRRSTSCAFCFPHLLLPQPHIVKPEGTTLPSLQPILIDDNGTPATWTLVLFQQAIDRQDRILQTEGRFSLLELLEIQPYQRNTPTTGQGLIARRR